MDLSVVVPTLNGRTRLLRCLDALSAHAPRVEVIVVNGPSTDGTTGAVREREDVDVLVEIADRNLNVARNAGIEHASGEWIAFVSDEYSIEPAWFEALGEAAREESSKGESRLGALPDSISDAGATLAEATRALTDRSKRLATRARTDAAAEDPDGPDVPGDPTDEFQGEDSADVSSQEIPIEGATSGDDANVEEADGDGRNEGAIESNDRSTDADREPMSADDSRAPGSEARSYRPHPEDPSGPPAVLTGPIHRELAGGTTTQFPQSRSIAGRSITYFNPDNVAFRREALLAADGFDEYLQVGGARDLAHRLAAGGYDVAWTTDMCVRGEYGTDGTGRDRRWDARSLSYRLAKNYGLRPAIVRRLVERTTGNGLSGVRGAIRGDLTLSQWFGAARDLAVGTVVGTLDGLRARWRDRGRHNPNGRSSRTDRAVTVYDRR